MARVHGRRHYFRGRSDQRRDWDRPRKEGGESFGSLEKDVLSRKEKRRKIHRPVNLNNKKAEINPPFFFSGVQFDIIVVRFINGRVGFAHVGDRSEAVIERFMPYFFNAVGDKYICKYSRTLAKRKLPDICHAVRDINA